MKLKRYRKGKRRWVSLMLLGVVMKIEIVFFYYYYNIIY